MTITEQPQPPSGSYPQAVPSQPLPTEAYTPWFSRVLAFLVDYLPYAIILGIGWLLLVSTQDATGASTVGQLSISIAFLVGLTYLIWNHGYRQGTTGSSIGKSVIKFKVVSEKVGQPIGFGMSIVRQLAHIVDMAICYIGYLFPLWDAKRQTLADKIMSTVCLPL